MSYIITINIMYNLLQQLYSYLLKIKLFYDMRLSFDCISFIRIHASIESIGLLWLIRLGSLVALFDLMY